MGIVVAIDGPAGSGKGTLSRALASELGLAVLDTGRLYRAVALRVLEAGIDPSDADACAFEAASLDAGALDGVDLSGERVGGVASRVAAHPGVRDALFDFQRRFAAHPPGGASGAVLDGRDIGTVVCPDADLKIFLVADLDARARRRHAEAVRRGDTVSFGDIRRAMDERDTREANRGVAPMVAAEDAIVLDTSWLTPEEVLEQAIGALAPRIGVMSL